MNRLRESRTKTNIGNSYKLESGVSNLTILVFGTLAAIVIFVGFRIIPFYYYYYELRGQIHSVSRVASEHSDKELRRRILAKIKELDIPANPDSLIINRYDNSIRVMLEYNEEFYLTYNGKDHTIKIFPFSIDMTTKY